MAGYIVVMKFTGRHWLAISAQYVCMYESIYNAPLLQPKQSRVRARRPNRKDVFSLLQKGDVQNGHKPKRPQPKWPFWSDFWQRTTKDRKGP